MYVNLWMGAVGTGGGAGGRLVVAADDGGGGGEEGGRGWSKVEGKKKKRNLSLGRSSLPSLVGPRQGHLAPGALHPFPPSLPILCLRSPFGPSLRRVAPLEPPPSSTLLSPLFLAVCFDFTFRFSLPLFLSFRRRSTKQDLFVMFFCFDLSVLLDREDGEGEEGELAQILNFFNFFSIRIYFDLGLLLGFSLKKGIVSLNFFLIFFYFNFFILVLSRSRSKENWSQTST